MRKLLSVVLAGMCLLTVPVFAGDVSVANGQATWKSTQCLEPPVPQALSSEVGSETVANDVNTRITQYNQYVKLVQAYMDCMSSEAQTDASMTSNAVVAAAEAQIAEVKQHTDALGMGLKK